MFKIILIFIISTNIFSQMLSMDERYNELYKNFKKPEFQEKTSKLLTVILENRQVVKEAKKILLNSYENKILQNKVIAFLVSIIYDNENSNIIKNTINELLEDQEFKTHIIKIVKTEKNSKEIFKLLKKFFTKKIDNRFNKVFQRYLSDKFLCQYNIDLTFSIIAKNLLTKEIENMVQEYYKENKLPENYIEKMKQKIVSLPYDYSIKNWFSRFYEDVLIKLKDYFNKNDGKFLINDNMENLELDIIYSLLQNDLLLKEFKKEFFNDFLKDRKMLKNSLKSALISDSDILLNKISEKRFNCFHLDAKMFNIDRGVLSLYLKEVFKLKEIDRKVLPILFKSLR